MSGKKTARTPEAEAVRPTKRTPLTDLAKVRVFLAEAWEVDEICVETGWSRDRTTALIAQVYAEDGRTVVGRSSEQVFVDFVVRSRANVRALQDLHDNLYRTNQGSAAVGAIKAQQEILQQIIRVGQELGIIEKKPERREVIFARLDDRELYERLSAEIRATRGMVASHADVPFLDVEPEPDCPAAPPAPAPIARATDPIRSGRTAQPPKAPRDPDRIGSVANGGAPIVKRRSIPLRTPAGAG